MSRLIRATGLAVAGLSAALGAAFAGPSFAEESNAAPITAHYTDHGAAVASSSGTDEPINLLNASNTAPAEPVLEHAVATVDSAALLSETDPISTEGEERAPAKSLSELVNAYASSDVPDSEFECLAGAIYFESKGEPLTGQLAVAEVIINRAKSGRFPASLCGVVKQRGQFSFVRAGRLPPIPRDSTHWRKAVGIAHVAQKELAEAGAPRALFFHARRVSPGWKLKRIASVGNHVFYR